MYNDVNFEVNRVINQIKHFWRNNVSNIHIQKITEIPFNMFSLYFTLYGDKQIIAEYERSTLGFYVLIQGEYVGLSKLSQSPIFRGFDSYSSENNILQNFKALDNVLKSIKC